VAEVQAQIVGFGLVRFGICQSEGQARPYAWLNSLMVDSTYRQQGIGGELALRRIALARERIGDFGLILTSVQSSNTASLATAKKWGARPIGKLQSALVPVLVKQPASNTGITVREVQASELGAVADGLNQFYTELELYERQTPETLLRLFQQTVAGQPINRCLGAFNEQQELVAGLVLSEQHRLAAMQVDRLPKPIAVLNRLIKMVPSDNVLRQMAISKIWHLPGYLQAAQRLWQTVRWQASSWGSHLTCFFDPQSSIPQILQIPKWLPKANFNVLAQGHFASDKVNLLYPL
jgi:hypothetical protein